MGIAKKLSNLDFEDPEHRAYHFTMSNEQITIGQILEMQPGTKDDPCWVNGEFTAVVESSASKQAKNGNPFVSGKLADPDTGASIAFSWFGRKAFPNPGATVLVGGSGISLGEYNGTPQLTFGKSTTCNVVSQGNAAPQTRSAAPARAGQPPARQNAGNGQGTAFLGVTVGMALNNAGLDYRAAGFNISDASKAKAFLWQRASLYLHLAAALEAGTLHGDTPAPARAAPPPQRQPEPPLARPTRPAPTDDGSAFGADNGSDDEVPF